MQAELLEGLEPALKRRVIRMSRGTLGRASSAAPGDQHGGASQPAAIIDAAPALASTKTITDRRSQTNRDLDEQAREVVAELHARNVDASKDGSRRLRQMLTHSLLCPLLFKVCGTHSLLCVYEFAGHTPTHVDAWQDICVEACL